MFAQKNWIISVTLLIITAVFAWYFLVYVKNNEEKITQKGFRNLYRLAENIEDKGFNLNKSVKIFSLKEDPAFTLSLKKSSEKGGKMIDASVYDDYFSDSYRAKFRDSVQEQFSNIGLDLYYVSNNADIAKEKVNAFKLNEREYLYFESKKDSLRSFFRVPIQQFIAPLLNESFFHDYIILQLDEITDKNKLHVLYQTLNAPVWIKNPDSLLNDQPDIISGSVRDINIGGTDYKLFYQPLTLSDGRKLLLGGLIETKLLISESRKVSPWIIIIVTLIMILIIFSFPLFKLFFMNKMEKLSISNVTLSITSIIIIPSLLLLFLLNFYSYYKHKLQAEHELEKISANIQTSFINELHAIYRQLEQTDKYFSEERTIRENNFENILSNPAFKLQHYPYLKELFWMDKNGIQNIQISILKKTDVGIDLKERKYFSRIIDNTHWYIPQIDEYVGPKKPFMIQSIYSWSTGENQVAISVPAKTLGNNNDKIIRLNEKDSVFNTEVVALTCNLYSLLDVIMPVGFGFCIIDDKGDVLFHNDKSKNLQQNLFAEASNSNPLKVAINNRNLSHGLINYQNQEQRFFIRPVTNLPLYLVTFHESQHFKAQESIINTSVTVIIFGGLIYFWLLFLTMSLCNIKVSKLKYHDFAFSWLNPTGKNIDSYYRLFYFYSFLTIVLVVFYAASQNLSDLLFYFTITITFTFALNYYIIKHRSENSSGPKSVGSFLYDPFLLICTVIIIGIHVIYMLVLNPERYWMALLFDLVVIAGFVASNQIGYFIKKRRKLKPTSKIKKNFLSYPNIYYLFLFLWLIINSIIPNSFLYRYTQNQQEKVWAQYSLLKRAQAIVNRNKEIDHYYNEVDNKDYIINKRKNEGIYFQSIEADVRNKEIVTDSFVNSDPDKFLMFMMYNLSPVYQPLIMEYKGLLSIDFVLDSWQWQSVRLKDDSTRQLLNLKFSDYSQDTIYNYAAAIPEYEFPISFFRPENSFDNSDTAALTFIFWIFFISILLIVYKILSFMIKRIFGLELISHPGLYQNNRKLLNKILESTGIKNNLFIVSLPYSGLKAELQEKLMIKNGTAPKVFQMDCLDLMDERKLTHLINLLDGDTYACFWIKHFEYSYEDLDTNCLKLKLLEHIVQKENARIIISSNVHPRQVLDYYNEKIERATDELEKTNLKIVRNKWSYLFYGFEKIYYPLTLEKKVAVKDEEDFKNFINNECRFGLFLQHTKRSINIYYDFVKNGRTTKAGELKEELILKTESLAQTYYYTIWYSCSKEERYILYDLSIDGFVNTKNRKAIYTLLEKGLLRSNDPVYDVKGKVLYYDDQLQIMNESFRNFILTSIKPKELLQMEKEQRKEGSWNSIKVAFIIILIGILFFLSIAQQEVLNNINALVAAFGAVLALVLRFGDLVNIRNPFKSPK